MQFQVVEERFEAQWPGEPFMILTKDCEWTDYARETQFRAYYALQEEEHIYLGATKILQAGSGITNPPARFEQIDERFCSLGQDLSFYRRVIQLGNDTMESILRGLRDLVFDPTILPEVEEDEGYRSSLVRLADAKKALALAGRVLRGEPSPEPAPLAFRFETKLPGFDAPHRLELEFPEEPGKLGRLMALVGKNGSGKTRLLAALAHALSGLDVTHGKAEPDGAYARVVAMSFSAFDQFLRPDESGWSYSYYGLRGPSPRRLAVGLAAPGWVETSIDMRHALDRLETSLRTIRWRGRDAQEEWRSVLDQAGVFRSEPHLFDPFEEGGPARFIQTLRDAGSGHQMLVLIVSGLLESLDEGALLLFDEPETHMHPALLSTFVRTVYEVLERRRAFALFATHSPIVVQEIPRRSLRVVHLEGRSPLIEPYERESFGENLGDIIHYAFEVDERDKSYATILTQLAEKMDRAQIEGLFEGGLGLGARMLLRTLFERKKERGS